MPRKSPFHIDLSPAEAAELGRMASKYTLPYFEVVRARMILMAAEGLSNDEIAARLDTRREPRHVQRRHVQFLQLARRDGEDRVLDDALRLVPVRQVRQRVDADDEVELIVQPLGGERRQRVGRVRRPAAPQLDVADAEVDVAGDGQFQHRQPVLRRADAAVALAPRVAGRDEEDFVEPKAFPCVLGKPQVR